MIIGYVNGQSLQLHHGRVVEKSIDYLTAEFHFMTNEWDNFDKYVHFVNGETHYKIKLTNNEVKKTDHLNLTAGVWKVYLHGVLSTEIVTTNQCELTVEGTGDISGGEGAGGIIQEAVKQAKEEYRSELETSIETATGENYDGKTWEELNNTVAELPIITEEQTQALGDWDLIKDYFADYNGKYHDLFSAGVRAYRLPYIYTPKMQWRANNCILSPYLVEFGVDVSSASGIGGFANYNTFSSATSLERIVLTGNAMQPSLGEFMRNNRNLIYLKMDTPSEEVLKANASYYHSAFNTCTSLQTIDCELDFTGQGNFTNTFYKAYKLKHFRIKPFTLSASLNLRDCHVLHVSGLDDYDSLISILNGITDDIEVAKNITLTFASTITDIVTGDVRYWSKLVYFRDGSNLYYSEPPEVTGDEAYFELSLYDAFINKGVTIAIV